MPCGAVRDLQQVLTDPHLLAREMIATVEHHTAGALRQIGIPVKLSETSGTIRSAPPTLGQHTESVLAKDLGVSAGELDTLRTSGIIYDRGAIPSTLSPPMSTNVVMARR